MEQKDSPERFSLDNPEHLQKTTEEAEHLKQTTLRKLREALLSEYELTQAEYILPLEEKLTMVLKATGECLSIQSIEELNRLKQKRIKKRKVFGRRFLKNFAEMGYTFWYSELDGDRIELKVEV